MNVLAIGAHFDDIELGCGGSVAAHVQNNDNVFAYVATKSGYKNPAGNVVRDDGTALKEGRRAIEGILGAKLICGSFETFKLECSDSLYREMLDIVEGKNIDLIYTHWRHDAHHDHSNLSKATLHVARHVPKVLMYRSNWYDSAASFNSNFYVDISDFYDKKMQAIKCHVSENNRTSSKWVEYFENECINMGCRAGVKYAEGFEVVRWVEFIG